MERVLVTGSEGFTGRYVAAALRDRKYQVYGLDFLERPNDPYYFQVDLTNPAAVLAVIDRIHPEFVVHLAAVAFVGNSDVKAMYLVNVVGTRNLLSALEQCGAGLSGIVLASSGNIYGKAYPEVPIREDFAPNPVNDYAISKLAMEHTAKLWYDKLPIVIARPFNYTGVGKAISF